MKMRRTVRSVMVVCLILTFGNLGLGQETPASKVDLNSADQRQLETLPGIGPAMAKRIVEFREKNGPFKRVEELMNVRGIGEKKYDQLKDLVSVSAVPEKKKGERSTSSG